MVGVLGVLILGSFLQTVVDTFSPLLELGAELEDREWTFVVLLFLVLFLLLIQMTVNFKTDSCLGNDGEGFGLGSILLLVVFFILYLIFTSE